MNSRAMLFGVVLGTFVVSAPTAVNATLMPVGDEINVVSLTQNYAYSPRLAIGPDGSFQVVWVAGGPAIDWWDIHTRAFDASGMPASNEFTVNTFTEGIQESPTITRSPAGDFLVSWDGRVSADPYDYACACRGLDAQGTPIGDIASLSGCQCGASDVLPDGGYVAVGSGSSWVEVPPDAGGPIGYVEGAIIDAFGNLTKEFRANENRDDPTGYGFGVDGETSVSISADALGRFIVGYDTEVQSYYYNVDEQVDGFNVGAKIERFVDGVSEGSIFLASPPESGITTSVALSPGGNAVAVYVGEGVFVRAFDCHGADLGSATLQPQRTTSESYPDPGAVRINEKGDAVAVWLRQSDENNGLGLTVIARRFQLTDGCALCGDADANGRVTAVDALATLRTSVGSANCSLERCDADGSKAVSTADALLILRSAVLGVSQPLACT